MFARHLTPLALFSAALSFPTSLLDVLPRQTYGGDGICDDDYEYTVISDTTAWSAVTVADGESCTSDAVEPCTVGQSYTKSFSITQEAGVSLDFEEIFSLDTSISYTITTATGYTVSEPCPPGGYVCGLTYTNNQANVAGIKSTVITGSCSIAGDIVKTEPYAFTAPVTVGASAQVTFAACISASSPNQTAVEGTPACPGGF